MRYRFDEIFEKNNSNGLSPRMPIYINGVTIAPGISFTSGVSFGGINFWNFLGCDVEVNQENGILVIKGFYR